MITHLYEDGEENLLFYYCPGCKECHSVPPVRWNWNGDREKPTLSPSVRHFIPRPDGTQQTTCHYFIRNGRIEFCGDCPHELKGMTVPLPEIPVDYELPGVSK